MSKGMRICLVMGILLMIAGLGCLLLPTLLTAAFQVFLPVGNEASSIAIIGGADGPTAIFVTTAVKTDSSLLPGASLALGSLLCMAAGLSALNRKRNKPKE